MWWFGKGKVELQLQKYNFSAGEVIQGSVVFKLKKVLHARAVKIRLAGIKHSSSYNAGKGVNQSNNDYVFDFVQPLDGEKDYSGEFSYNVRKVDCSLYAADSCFTTVLF